MNLDVRDKVPGLVYGILGFIGSTNLFALGVLSFSMPYSQNSFLKLSLGALISAIILYCSYRGVGIYILRGICPSNFGMMVIDALSDVGTLPWW